MESLWKQTSHLPHFPPLEGDAACQVLVIGGGMAGVLCAHFLQEAGVDCILAEAGRIGGGVTGNTTAKITLQHALIYAKLVRRFGPGTAKLYYGANAQALEEYARLCRDIDCDFQRRDSYVYALGDDKKLRRELEALALIGAPGELVRDLPLPFPTAGAVRIPRQAQFHPLKFLAALTRGLKIYENTPVLELAPGRARTPGGTIRAQRTVVATHFPILNKHGSYFLKLYQHRSYVLALAGAQDVEGMFLDENEKGLSFRNAQGYLLLGGGSHRTGKKGGGFKELEETARRLYPRAEIRARWATQDCMSLDGVPYVGPYSARTPDLFVATGFNKWGMTGAMAAARLLRDQILGRESPYALLFSPSRSLLRPQLFANLLESTAGLLTPTRPRCPHLGCALKWNAAERSWDCSCHGSRFEEKGRLITGPATGDLKK